MKSLMSVIQTVLLSLVFASACNVAQAEILTQVNSDIPFPAATLGSKSAVADMMNKKRLESANDLLTQAGFDTRLEKGVKAVGLIGINNLRVPVLINGERKMIDLINVNDFKDVIIPPAIKDLKQASADAAKSVPFTGSIGAAFGLIGWAVNQAYDAKRESDIPFGVVVANIQIKTTDDKDKQPRLANVVITAASDQAESPTVLFDAVIHRVLEVFENGYAEADAQKN